MRASISRAELCAFIRTLGADPDQVSDLEFDVGQVKVTTYLLDEHGQRHVEGGVKWAKPGDRPPEVATETTVIPVVGDGKVDTVPMRHPTLPGRVIDVRPRAVGQRAMAGWEVVDPPPEPPKVEPRKGGRSKAPATAGASSSPTPRGRRKAKEEQ